jgi:hypothetical protein
MNTLKLVQLLIQFGLIVLDRFLEFLGTRLQFLSNRFFPIVGLFSVSVIQLTGQRFRFMLKDRLDGILIDLGFVIVGTEESLNFLAVEAM